MYKFLPAKRFEILSIIEKDEVVRLTAHLEPFLTIIRKRWIAEIGVEASHNDVTIEEKEKRKRETREIRDKNKKRQRKNQ